MAIEIDIDKIAEAVSQKLRAEQEKLLVLPELADRLDMSPRGVTGLVAKGELPQGYLIGGCRRWDWNEVLAYIRERSKRKPRRKRRGQYERG